MKRKMLKITITAIILLIISSLLALCSFNYLDPDLRKLSFLIPTRFYSNIVGIDARILKSDKICQIRYLWNLDATEEEKAKSVEKVRRYFSDYLNNHSDCFLNDSYEIYVIFYYEKNGLGNYDRISFSNYDPIAQKTTGTNFYTIALIMHNISCLQFFDNVSYLNIIPLENPSEKFDNSFNINIFENYTKIKYVIFNDLYWRDDESNKTEINDFEIKVSNAISVNSPNCLFYYSDFYNITDTPQYIRFRICSFDFRVIGHMDLARLPSDE